MSKQSILITRAFFSDILDPFLEKYEAIIWPEKTQPPYDWILNNIQKADALICMLNDKIDDNVINSGGHNKLKVISQMAVGVDNIAMASASAHNIPVGHTPGVLTETTADFTWALLMASARRVVESHIEVHNGIWQPWGPEVFCGVDLYGAKLGLIGFGRIGKAVARRAAGFNMQVLYHEPRYKPLNKEISNARYVSFEELLAESDFVSLHAYLSDATCGMISKAQLEQMKPSAILINTARGAMVDHSALYEAIKSKRIAGAALDVFDPEPMPKDHPLLTLPNVIITPHIASSTIATRRRMAMMTIENISAGLNDKPLPYCFNPEVYS